MDDIEINSNQFWFKIVGFLQQNWALIESQPIEEKVIVYFIQDASMIFDKIEFETKEQAKIGLIKNGFKKHLDKKEKNIDFIVPPQKPFKESIRPIYSSGQFWQK
jgi:hypothetical protein